MPRAMACRTKVVVTQPASACNRNSTGLAPSLLPSSTGGSPLVNSKRRARGVLLAGAVEVADHRAVLAAVDPGVARPELELGKTLVGLDGGDGVDGGMDVEAVETVGFSRTADWAAHDHLLWFVVAGSAASRPTGQRQTRSGHRAVRAIFARNDPFVPEPQE